MKFSLSLSLIFASLQLLSTAVLAEEHPSINYPTNLAPSAQLHYHIKAKQSGFSLDGEADVNWQVGGSNSTQTYSIKTETRAAILGKILQADSTGLIDSFGLAPDQFEEKRLGKPATQTRFDRKTKTLNFSESSETYPLKGGEQDRTSAVWQLVSIARAAPAQFIPNSQWKLFVAGRRDAEKWTFTVDDNVTISTPFGNVATVHIIKAPPPDSKDQRLDIWLAPSMEWYPVRLKFSDANGDTIDQILDRVKNNP
ncbi:DUF3108 domain-containing protein [Solimicrobium silvestre]|uniref:DUF3108 domain-containing protein n=1 Tax=Solimicrobium silvestre TaxID=2099400 RepID=A0A2S9H210_9BURK|nr:DUF3108 domain-containing protein [Solimicrobium silvestre]PRC94024.1 hypothetical protein S2091_1197 [Solimicrobium silvestre]